MIDCSKLVGQAESGNQSGSVWFGPEGRLKDLKVANFSLSLILSKLGKAVNRTTTTTASSSPVAIVCPHPGSSCLQYVGWGAAKPFVAGIGIQTALLAFKLIRRQRSLDRIEKLLSYENLQLGLFLGSFGGLYKACMQLNAALSLSLSLSLSLALDRCVPN